MVSDDSDVSFLLLLLLLGKSILSSPYNVYLGVLKRWMAFKNLTTATETHQMLIQKYND